MISILIPTYNYNCYRLVCDLHTLCEKSETDYEILVGDDCSRDQLCKIANMKVSELSNCKYIQNDTNKGIAAMRNKLARLAKGKHLLFIDSDAKVCDNNFIDKYIQHSDDADIVVGSIQTPFLHKDEIISVCETADLGKLHSHFIVNRTLRYKYERNADKVRSAAIRNHSPYSQISCFNILINRDVFKTLTFDETCTEYGYEDALFGAELKRNGFTIKHIDNPLLHMGIDTNESFLKKTETAIKTLIKLDKKMQGDTRLGNTASCIQSLHLTILSTLLFKLFKPIFRRNLLSTHPSLTAFSIYKLGVYLSLVSGKAQ